MGKKYGMIILRRPSARRTAQEALSAPSRMVQWNSHPSRMSCPAQRGVTISAYKEML